MHCRHAGERRKRAHTCICVKVLNKAKPVDYEPWAVAINIPALEACRQSGRGTQHAGSRAPTKKAGMAYYGGTPQAT